MRDDFQQFIDDLNSAEARWVIETESSLSELLPDWAMDLKNEIDVPERLRKLNRQNPVFHGAVRQAHQLYLEGREDDHRMPEAKLRDMPPSVRVRALELAVIALAERNRELERHAQQNMVEQPAPVSANR